MDFRVLNQQVQNMSTKRKLTCKGLSRNKSKKAHKHKTETCEDALKQVLAKFGAQDLLRLIWEYTSQQWCTEHEKMVPKSIGCLSCRPHSEFVTSGPIVIRERQVLHCLHNTDREIMREIRHAHKRSYIFLSHDVKLRDFIILPPFPFEIKRLWICSLRFAYAKVRVNRDTNEVSRIR